MIAITSAVFFVLKVRAAVSTSMNALKRLRDGIFVNQILNVSQNLQIAIYLKD